MTQPMDYEGFYLLSAQMDDGERGSPSRVRAALAFIRAAVPLLRTSCPSSCAVWAIDPCDCGRADRIRALTATFPDDFGSD